MVDKLWTLLDSLNLKQEQVESIIEFLGGIDNSGFIDDEITMVEKMIVEAYGGNDEHFKRINSSDAFWCYKKNDMKRREIIEYIKETVENNFSDEDETMIFDYETKTKE